MSMEIKSMEELDAILNQPTQVEKAPEEKVVDTPKEVVAEKIVEEKVVDIPKEAVAEKAEEVIAEKKAVSLQNILANMSIDVSNVKIVRASNPLGVQQELDNLFLKPSYEVIALQSGYRAALQPMNNIDMIRVRKFTGTEKEQNLKLFALVFNHIVNSGLGKIKFEEWLKITSEADFPTFVYGIYCATFPEKSEYNVTCPHCGKENTTAIGKEYLVQVNDQSTGPYITQILSQNYPPSELVKHSVVNMKERYVLPTSKVVLDVVTPTLSDYIKTLQRAENFKGIEREIFAYLNNIGDVFIPHLQAFSEGRAEFIQLETIEEKARVIADIPPSDKKALETFIKEKADKYRIDYKLPDFKCSGCDEEIKNIIVDMADVLFQSMARA